MSAGTQSMLEDACGCHDWFVAVMTGGAADRSASHRAERAVCEMLALLAHSTCHLLLHCVTAHQYSPGKPCHLHTAALRVRTHRQQVWPCISPALGSSFKELSHPFKNWASCWGLQRPCLTSQPSLAGLLQVMPRLGSPPHPISACSLSCQKAA